MEYPSILRGSACIVISLVMVLAVGSHQLLEAVENSNTNRPKIGLVLGGGGARGAAHAGVLKVLEENNIPIDYIVGTSMGSIVGGLYASGMSPDEMKKFFDEMDWNDIFSDRPSEEYLSFRNKQDEQRLMGFELGVTKDGIQLPRGVIAGQKLDFLLKQLTLHVADIHDFDNLPIPFRAVATDLGKGEEVVLGKGNLSEAIRASMSIPGVFPPVELNGRVLVDGFAVNNVPINVAREMGADIVIAISVDQPLKSVEQLKGLVDITGQLMGILSQQNVERSLQQLTEHDLLIYPDLGDITTGDYNRTPEIVTLGEQAARQKISELRRYSVSNQEYKKYLARQRKGEFQPFTIDTIEIAETKRVSHQRIKGVIKTKEGEELDLRKLQDDLTRIYSMGDFETVNFEIDTQEEGNTLLITPKEKSWGPNYLRFGLNLAGDLDSGAEFNVLTDYRMTQLNRFGGEWRTVLSMGETLGICSELYQPIDVQNYFFLVPRFRFERTLENIYQGNDRIAEYRVTRTGGGLDFGINFSSLAEGRIGIVRSSIDAEAEIGGTNLPSLKSIQEGAIVASLQYDQLDNHVIPKHGIKSGIRLFASDESLGADFSYEAVEAMFMKATTFNERHSILISLEAGTSIDENTPYYDQFILGGFMSLSGYAKGQLRGQHKALGCFTSYYKLGDDVLSLMSGMHVGGALEAGNTWNDRDDIDIEDFLISGTVFVAFDTLLGPVYVGYAKAESTPEGRFYMLLGKVF